MPLYIKRNRTIYEQHDIFVAGEYVGIMVSIYELQPNTGGLAKFIQDVFISKKEFRNGAD